MKKKPNLENVFEQLSNADNIDNLLRDEGLIPEHIVKIGLEKLKTIKFNQASKKRVVDLIKVKMNNSISKEALKVMNSLSELIPSMSGRQVDIVFRSLNNPSESSEELDFLIQDLKSNVELKKIMKTKGMESTD